MRRTPISVALAILAAGCTSIFEDTRYSESVDLQVELVSGAQLHVLDSLLPPGPEHGPSAGSSVLSKTLADDLYIVTRCTNRGGRAILGFTVRLTKPHLLEGQEIVVVPITTFETSYAVRKVASKGFVISEGDALELVEPKVEWDIVSLQVK